MQLISYLVLQWAQLKHFENPGHEEHEPEDQAAEQHRPHPAGGRVVFDHGVLSACIRWTNLATKRRGMKRTPNESSLGPIPGIT